MDHLKITTGKKSFDINYLQEFKYILLRVWKNVYRHKRKFEAIK